MFITGKKPIKREIAREINCKRFKISDEVTCLLNGDGLK